MSFHPRTNRQTRKEARRTATTQRKIQRAGTSTDWNSLALALIEVQR